MPTSFSIDISQKLLDLLDFLKGQNVHLGAKQRKTGEEGGEENRSSWNRQLAC